jgi:hypothetical protein
MQLPTPFKLRLMRWPHCDPRLGILATVVIVMSACAALPDTDFIEVEGRRYVPAPSSPIPNYRFGWVPTTLEDAPIYAFRLGSRQVTNLQREQSDIGGRLFLREATKLAERELRKLGLCLEKVVRAVNSVTREQSDNVWHFSVECVKVP